MEASGVASAGSNEGELRTMSAENINERETFTQDLSPESISTL